MRIEIFLTPSIQRAAGNKACVRVEGKNIGECLKNLTEGYPELKQIILNKEGGLSSQLTVYLRNKIVYPFNPALPVKDGDEIHIVDIVVGG